MSQITVPGAGCLWDSRDTDSLGNTRHKDARRSCSRIAQTPPKSKLYLQAPRTFKESDKLMAFLITDYGFSLGGWADSPRNTVKNHPGLGQPTTFFLYYNRIRGTRNGEHLCHCAQVSAHTKRSRKLHQQNVFYIATFFIWKCVCNAVNLVMLSSLEISTQHLCSSLED